MSTGENRKVRLVRPEHDAGALRAYARKGNGPSAGENPAPGVPFSTSRDPPLPLRQRLVPHWTVVSNWAYSGLWLVVFLWGLGLLAAYDPHFLNDAYSLVILMFAALVFRSLPKAYDWRRRHHHPGPVPPPGARA